MPDSYMKPTISVVIPSFNQGDFIGETLESIRRQRYAAIEVIVMDGGSTDDTSSVVGSFGDMVTIYVSEPDKGQSHAINKAIRLARGSIIAWQNSDDVFVDQNAFQQAEEAIRSGNADIVYGDTAIIDGRSRVIRMRYGMPPSLPFFINYRMFIANQSAFMSRTVVEKIGCFDESLHYAMDVEFYLRCLSKGIRFKYVPSLWGAYRIHDKAKFGSDLGLKWASEMKLVYEHYGVRKTRRQKLVGLAEILVSSIRYRRLSYYFQRYVLRATQPLLRDVALQ
ncbi:glycosyltransferase [Candidatus Poribacteria bacterium]|nr:glycosyltransferase [Candidatus Poribacteria bacterium]